MNLILPIAGKSSRFVNTRPKWMLTHPNGNLMITEAIKGLPLHKFNNIFIIMLKEHVDTYINKQDLYKEINETYNVSNIDIISLLSSDNQPHTIYQGINFIKLNYPDILSKGIFIKDCDNYFKLDDINKDQNFITVSNLNNNQEIVAGNKSYIQLGNSNTIVNIVEKQIISNLFCCGGYFFKTAKSYINTYESLPTFDNLYLSHVIYKQILEGELFFINEATNYIDWGTINDWNKYKSQFKVYFIDIDGVLVENSAKRFNPKWGTTNSIKENIEIINQLYSSGKGQIILTTSRSDNYKIITETQLNNYGLKYHKLITGLNHGQRILINDYAPSNPYPSAIAINIERNSNKLKDLL